MPFHLTQEAAERPRRTIHAAEIFHMNARSIAAACRNAAPHELVVAVVGQNLTLAGVWTFPKTELTVRVPGLDMGGWTVVFSPGTPKSEVEERAQSLARSAFKRWEALRRWDSKQI